MNPPDDESVTTLEDLRSDLALRYKWTSSGGSAVDPALPKPIRLRWPATATSSGKTC